MHNIYTFRFAGIEEAGGVHLLTLPSMQEKVLNAHRIHLVVIMIIVKSLSRQSRQYPHHHNDWYHHRITGTILALDTISLAAARLLILSLEGKKNFY